jgi:hypothetical protein
MLGGSAGAAFLNTLSGAGGTAFLGLGGPPPSVPAPSGTAKCMCRAAAAADQAPRAEVLATQRAGAALGVSFAVPPLAAKQGVRRASAETEEVLAADGGAGRGSRLPPRNEVDQAQVRGARDAARRARRGADAFALVCATRRVGRSFRAAPTTDGLAAPRCRRSWRTASRRTWRCATT